MTTVEQADRVFQTEFMVYLSIAVSIALIAGMVSVTFWTKHFINPVDRLVTAIVNLDPRLLLWV